MQWLGRVPPPPLWLAKKARPAIGLLRTFWTGVMVRGRLKASGLASLCLKSLSSGDNAVGSLLERKLSTAVLAGLRVAINRSGARIRVETSVGLSNIVNDGLR